jgi:predicted ester cyclase
MPPDATPIGKALRQRRQEVLERLLHAQNSNDMATALECFAHPRYELIGNHRVYDGAEEVRRYYETARGYFPDLHLEIQTIHHADDAAIAEVRMSGTLLGSGPHFEATGKRFQCLAAIIFRFDNDQLIGARAYYDTGTIARQLA